MNDPSPSRRDFLKTITTGVLTGSGLLGLGGVLRYLSYSTEPEPPTEFVAGSAADYPVGSRTMLPDIPALLIRTDAGFTALSLVCTHLGCTVLDTPDGLICPCHGSRFDPQGNPPGNPPGAVQRGPAPTSLHTLRVEITADDQVHVFTV